MSEAPSDLVGRRRGLILAALALIVLMIVGGLLLGRKPEVQVASREEAPPEAPQPSAAPLSPTPVAPRPTASASAKSKFKPLEYMGDGIPIMPPEPDAPHDQPMHPHPITSAHLRIYRENNLLYQLNEAMDGRESVRLRALLAIYREEYPEDPNDMQTGYELIADCLDRPSPEVRARAEKYFKEEIASTLRRFVKRHCLETPP